MANTLVKMYVHIVFHIKDSSVKILECDLPRLFEFIGGIIRKNNGIPIMVGGVQNHIHILCTLPKTMTLSNLVRMIKVGSHRFLENNHNDHYQHFSWQDGYGAFSVSESGVDAVSEYIKNQKSHHCHVKSIDEYKLLLGNAGIEYEE